MAEPPSYSARDHHARSRQSAGSSNLGAGVLGATYTISLENSKAHKWLSMRVLSRSSNPTSPPYFYQGDKITGHVDLDVLKSEAIKAITIKVTGSTTFVGQEENEFLMIEKELWSPSIPLSDGSKVLKFEKGKFSWPFSISLPSDVELHDGKTKRTFPLPSTFSERASAGYLDYKLTVTVRRGGLKFNQTLAASFAYVPVTRPQPPSLMLQKAFKENFPIVGPRGDPTGWHVLPTVTIKGTLFASRQVEISCILALANPLTYARGSAAPVWLTMLGTDIQALDLLSAPSAVQLFLVRSLATGLDATTDMDSAERRTDNFFVETVSKGVFWPAKNSSKSMIEKEVSRKVLQGEVEVKRSLKPSCLFPKFTTRYHVELRHFDAPGFVPIVSSASNTRMNVTSRLKLTPGASGMMPLSKCPVTVVTFPYPGVFLRSHAPPGYSQQPGGDYNNSVGLLDSGNLRFYHHGGHGAG